MKTKTWKNQQYTYAGRATIPCWLCGKNLTKVEATVDHVIPKLMGGSNDPSNYRMACKKCNGRKGSKALSRKCKAKRNWNAAQRGY